MPDEHDRAVGLVDRGDDRVDVVTQPDAAAIGVRRLEARQRERAHLVTCLFEHGPHVAPRRAVEPEAGDQHDVHTATLRGTRQRDDAVRRTGAGGRGC
jgi:hypothetical protein